MNNQPLEGGSSISEGTMSKETLEDSERGVLAGLKASLSLHSLALARDLDLGFKLDTDDVLEGGLYNM